MVSNDTKNRKGSIFLAGGGSADESAKFDKVFLSILHNKTILYIPIAMEPGYFNYETHYDWIVATLTRLTDEFLSIDMCTDLNRIDLKKILLYDAVYIGGGNTYRLANLMRASGFDEILKEYNKRGGVIYGGSAGAIVLGKYISTVKEEDNDRASDDKGFNMLGGFSVRCHFKNNSDIQSFNYEQLSENIILMEDTAGILYKESVFKVITGDVFIFNNETVSPASSRF